MNNTFAFVVVSEVIMLILHLAWIIYKPQDKTRWRYVLLLVLLILHNFCRIFFPDQSFFNFMSIQIAITNLVGFVLALYFGYFLYKEFDVKQVALFVTFKALLLLPFVALFLYHEFDDNLKLNVVPFLLSVGIIHKATRVLLRKMKQSRLEHNDRRLAFMISAYVAYLGWATIPVLLSLEDFHIESIIFANAAFISMAIAYLRSSICEARKECARLEQMVSRSTREYRLGTNCLKYNLTTAEIGIIDMIVAGQQPEKIAEFLLIPTEAVNTHISNIYQKVGASNETELIYKLLY